MLSQLQVEAFWVEPLCTFVVGHIDFGAKGRGGGNLAPMSPSP